MTGNPTRRVMIEKDRYAPLWAIRCVVPCDPKGWCLKGPEGRYPRHCWLGSSSTEESARNYALSLGYEVVVPEPGEALPGALPAG